MGDGRTLRDRMNNAGPLWRAMATRFEQLIAAINELRTTLVLGQNPHKVNDTADAITIANANSLDSVIDLEQQLIDNYETHIGSTSYHLAADSTNVVTELGVAKEAYTLLNELKVDYEANRVNVTSHHGGSGDTTNTVTAVSDATTKATAITLANALKTKLIAHMALTAGSVHGAADAVNGVALAAIADLTSTATWTQITAMADAIRVAYEAHRVYTTNSVHAGADSTNTVTATAVGTIQTAVNAGLTELKGDFNAHVAEFGTSHAVKDTSSTVSAANATSLNTSIALANALKVAINDHISRADEFAAIGSLDLEE